MAAHFVGRQANAEQGTAVQSTEGQVIGSQPIGGHFTRAQTIGGQVTGTETIGVSSTTKQIKTAPQWKQS